MGEVVDINILSKENKLLTVLYELVQSIRKGDIISQTIEVMDNWMYENSFEISEFENISDYIDNKILSITQITSQGVWGITGERNGDVYSYCVWFNPSNNISGDYSNVIRCFVEYISCYHEKNKIILCGIGKETKFEYEFDLFNTIKLSHNIDIWIVNKNDYSQCYFPDYKICSIDNFENTERAVVII